jgi:hypothetical protein
LDDRGGCRDVADGLRTGWGGAGWRLRERIQRAVDLVIDPNTIDDLPANHIEPRATHRAADRQHACDLQ